MLDDEEDNYFDCNRGEENDYNINNNNKNFDYNNDYQSDTIFIRYHDLYHNKNYMDQKNNILPVRRKEGCHCCRNVQETKHENGIKEQKKFRKIYGNIKEKEKL